MTALPVQRVSPWKQFWILFIFQAQALPKLWRVPLYMLLIFFNDWMSLILPVDTSSPPEMMISNLSLFFLASLLFLSSQTPFFSRVGSKKYFPTAHQWMELSGGFLLMQAVDRRLIHRSMTLLMYLLILAVPVGILLLSLRHPGLKLSFFRDGDVDQYLTHLPESRPIAPMQSHDHPDIFVPRGRVFMAEWHLWAYLVGMLTIQLIYLIDPFKRLGWIKSVTVHMANFLILFTEGVLVIGLISLLNNQSLFFAFLAHQTAFWLLMVPIMILGQLCCERLFSKLEQG
jgi:hypothetical protein